MDTSRMYTIMGMAMHTAYHSGAWKTREDFENDEEWDVYSGMVKEMSAMKETGQQVMWMLE